MPAKVQQSDDNREEENEENTKPGEIGKKKKKVEEEEEAVSGGWGGLKKTRAQISFPPIWIPKVCEGGEFFAPISTTRGWFLMVSMNFDGS